MYCLCILYAYCNNIVNLLSQIVLQERMLKIAPHFVVNVVMVVFHVTLSVVFALTLYVSNGGQTTNVTRK